MLFKILSASCLCLFFFISLCFAEPVPQARASVFETEIVGLLTTFSLTSATQEIEILVNERQGEIIRQSYCYHRQTAGEQLPPILNCFHYPDRETYPTPVTAATFRETLLDSARTRLIRQGDAGIPANAVHTLRWKSSSSRTFESLNSFNIRFEKVKYVSLFLVYYCL